MFTKKMFGFIAFGLLSTGAIAGCAADTANGDDVTEESEGELTAAGKALIGSYKDDSGSFRGLILTSIKAGSANKFTADVDTGIRCITAPCPSSERITGTFTATTKTITLRSTDAQHSAHLLGKYNYLVQGNKLSLWRAGLSQSLEKVPSYCSVPSDCYDQNVIHPMCMGGFTCGAQNTCSWSCEQWPPPPPACVGLDLDACVANAACAPKFGPSACSPDGQTCTADMAFKGCSPKN